jgi:hypothetical protein
MALGFNTETNASGSKFLPVVKFDAKSGDMLAVNREPAGDGTWEKNEVEISFPVKVIMALDDIEMGWITFSPNYHAVMVKAGERFPAKPGNDYKQAARIKIFLKEHGLREFTPTSKTVLRAVDTLHDQFIEQAPANQGKVPVVTIEGTEVVKIKTPEGELRFKAPKWSITSWVTPPSEMKEEAAPAAPQPAPKAAAKAPAKEELDEF